MGGEIGREGERRKMRRRGEISMRTYSVR